MREFLQSNQNPVQAVCRYLRGISEGRSPAQFSPLLTSLQHSVHHPACDLAGTQVMYADIKDLDVVITKSLNTYETLHNRLQRLFS